MRKYIPLAALVLIAAVPVMTPADTIYLKNGSIIRGKVVNFSDDQFSVVLNIGSDRSRAQIYVGDVTKIEFDSTGGGVAADVGPNPSPSSSQPPIADNTQRPNPENSGPPPSSSTSEQQPPPDQAQQPPPDREKQQPPPDREKQQPPSTPPPDQTQPASDSGTLVTKPPANAKLASVDVLAKRDWTSTGLIVRRGDHIRINASGTVTLDPNSGQTSGPEGIDSADTKKLMPERPTGALIAVIGADNDDFIFIGKSAEFTASRDGLLFLSVNEGNLSDNVGSYKADIEVDPGTR